MTIASTGGTATITMTDESTGTVLGSQTFPFMLNNDVATFSQPDTVNNWMHSYSTYQGNVEIGMKFYTGLNNPPAGQSGSLTVTAQYAGSPYASSKLIDLGPIKPPPCPSDQLSDAMRNCNPEMENASPGSFFEIAIGVG